MTEGVITTVDTEEEVIIAVVEEVMIATTTAIEITIDVAGEFHTSYNGFVSYIIMCL